MVLTIKGMVKTIKGVYREEEKRHPSFKMKKNFKERDPRKRKAENGSRRNGKENQRDKEGKGRHTQVWKPKKHQKGRYP